MDIEPITPISKTPKRSRIARNRVINVVTAKRTRSRLDNNFIGRDIERFFKDERGQTS
jgi:hypothetical protein